MPTVKLVPSQSRAVFATVNSTGKLAGTDAIGLHEAVLARRRVERGGESLIIEKVWPEHIERVQIRNLNEEYARLVAKYGKDDVVAVYGEAHTGRLRSVMDRIVVAFERGMSVDRIIDLGHPDSDGMDIVDGIEPPPGFGKTVMKDPDSQDRRPSMSQTLREVEAESDNEDGKKQPKPAGIDDGDEVEEKPLDGKLVEFLKDIGWNEPESLAVARLVKEHGIKQIPDEPLKALRTFANAAARKKIRQNLASYDPSIVVQS